MSLSKGAVFALFSREAGAELRLRDISKRLGIGPAERRELKNLLIKMVHEDLLRLRKGRWYRRGASPVLEDLGKDPGDPRSRRRAIFDSLIEEAGLSVSFPSAVSAEASSVPDAVETLPEGMEDLSHLPLVTIDPADARDYDDAVAAVARPDGAGVRLVVAIADVSHYVKDGSVIDREALRRGVSVYLPGEVLPMLPFELSAGVCSLKPGVKRLALVVLIDYDEKGELEGVQFTEGLICSRAAYSYEQARDILAGSLVPEEDTADSFTRMLGLFHRLERRRRGRGALELEVPEARVRIGGDGRVNSLEPYPRYDSHRMIEAFMLAANEAVAHFLAERKAPLIYRIHEEPDTDKLAAVADTASSLGYLLDLRGGKMGKRINAFLLSIRGSEDSGYLNTLILRSLKQACYSTENAGHFGLALGRYCHFTSPIRRYPDLEVHRSLKSVLAGKKGSGQEKKIRHRLAETALQNSEAEQRSVKVERKARSVCQAEYMQDFIVEQYKGLITGVEKFGIFVQLANPFVEGLVHVSQLKDDFYHLEEAQHALVGFHKHRRFRMGDEIEVQLIRVDVPLGRVDFRPLEQEGEGGRPRRNRRTRVKAKSEKSRVKGRRRRWRR